VEEAEEATTLTLTLTLRRLPLIPNVFASSLQQVAMGDGVVGGGMVTPTLALTLTMLVT
jgi:hypothetical protein